MGSTDVNSGATREGITVRAATAADTDAILEVRHTGAKTAFGAASDHPDVFAALVDERRAPEKLIQEFGNESCYLLVAELDGLVVGSAALTTEGDSGEMNACFCSVRGRGVGSALMNARLDLARKLGLTSVWIETDTINIGGIMHAQRHGFQETAWRRGKTVPGNYMFTFRREL